MNGVQDDDPIITGLLQTHTHAPGVMGRHDAPLDRTQPYLPHVRSLLIVDC